MYDKGIIGENLRLCRKRNKVRQQDIADELKVSRNTMSKIENGYIYPPLHVLIGFSECFNIKISELLGEVDVCNETH